MRMENEERKKLKVRVVDFYVDLRGWYYIEYSDRTAAHLTKDQVIEQLNLALEDTSN